MQQVSKEYQDYQEALKNIKEATADLQKAAVAVRKEADETARIARTHTLQGVTVLGGTLAVWIAANIFDLPLHTWWYYVPTVAFACILLAIAAFARILHEKYLKMLAEVEIDLQQK